MAQGRLKHGQTIDQDKICQELQVSKAPLRDALIRLEEQRFVKIIPRSGVIVSPLTREYIKNAYDIIGSIESTCAFKAATRITLDDIVKLENSNTEQKKALECGEYSLYYRLNLEFHEIFLSYAAGPLHNTILTPLKQRLYDFPIRPYIKEWEYIHLEEHERLIGSLKKQNPLAAVTIIRDEHWSYTVHSRFLEQFYPELAQEEGSFKDD